MTSVEEHARHIRTLFAESVSLADGATELPLAEALGRMTASVVRSPIDLPLFRNSQMDGYAVRSADLAQLPVSLPVTGDIPAGPANPPALTPGTAVRIMTGAVVPEGADCVVPVEDVEVVPGV